MKKPILIAALLAAGPATQAHASAWPQPAGEGQVIVTGVLSHSGKGFDANGDVVGIADYDKDEAYALIEYGATDDLTLIATPSYSHVKVENGGKSGGAGYTEFGARYRVTRTDDSVFSLQGSFRIPGRKRRDAVAQIGATDSEIDLRALAGQSFKLGNTDVFVDLQAGYRIRKGHPPNEYRADITFGVRPTPKLLLMTQSFNVVSDGDGRGIFSKYRYHNVYASAVYDVTPKWSLQAGVLGTVAGKNALRERGLLVGVWRKF